ncbi:uncharacterized protein YbjT (DUF2867 family) [Actinoalloteichus hoggarensis]|uniref:NAD(P)H azoreductase n=1 Tax=Actinoalloteichus hoggarensis TaxID=1470176 RepID=A0A221VYP0_9PSEU|nr:NmrA/HSCARG family protein [Actinoalloteichus hoggarensis]ASO18662.1 NAD(P)H azoreductase [Actinoalloteichus hoggarensis]MBB5919893.1 uncharacterized protein YbjT (DUF2867 family) [Actinoalloteichus hoggarensis]
MSESSFVLVTGATGQQGGAAVTALLQSGQQVRALVRDPAAPRAEALAERGVTLVTGDLDDPASLVSALEGARGVFSVQMPNLADLLGDQEVRHATNLAGAAAKAGVEQIVHTSVTGTGTREPFDAERWGAFVTHYWRSKAAAEHAVREAALRRTTFLRPGTFMENLLSEFSFFPDDRDRVLTAVDPEVPQPFVAVADIGSAAAAAFADPERFDGVELELASDRLTYREVAVILSDVLGRSITLPADQSEAEAAGLPPEFARSQQYYSAVTLPAHPDHATALGLPTTSFADWARAAF